MVYVLLLLLPLHAFHLWYDELHTFYIAQAPSVSSFVDEVSHTDLNPPLLYALVRISFDVFGVSATTTRIPSMIAFLLASFGVFIFLRRRIGALWAAAFIGLVWYSPTFRYATEARPYGLMLGFFALTLVAWDSVEDPKSRRRALAGIAFGNCGMMLSHILAPLSIFPFCVAELVRNTRARKLDWPVWAALLLPLGCAAVYIPFLHRLDQAIYPEAFQASWKSLAHFYTNGFSNMLWVLPISLVLAFVASRGTLSFAHRSSRGDWPLFAAAMLPPAIATLLMMRSGGPFWDRYAITTTWMIYAGVTLLAARAFKWVPLAGFIITAILLGVHTSRDLHIAIRLAHQKPTVRFADYKPELPLVANNGLTFLEMDHDEDAALVRRLYYLTDPAASLLWSHSTLFNDLPSLKRYFPIRANFASYSDFLAEHHHFLVFGMPEQPEHWVIRRLIYEKADVHLVGDFDTQYQGSRLYEVTISP